jgi:SAM-dependent methyltransferase
LAGDRAPAPDFGRLAADYDRLRPIDDNWWRLFELLVDEGDLAGRRVLDVGAGTGTFATALAKRGSRVWGIDPSEKMVAQAQARAGRNVRFKRGRAEALPFKEGWFERAVLRLIVHLVDRPKAFAELGRVLVADGRAIVATFAPDSFERAWLTPYFPEVMETDLARFPSAETLAKELAAAGFATRPTRHLVQQSTLTRDDALERIRERYISTLQLVDDDAYAAGLARAGRELPEQVDDTREWLIVVAEKVGT